MLMIAFGAAFSVVQWQGTGNVEMPVGTLFEVIALVLLLVSVPSEIQRNDMLCRFTSGFGNLSAYIYITHLFWRDIYTKYIRNRLLYALGETVIDYLSPVLVVLISVGTGVVWLILKASAEKVLRLLSDSSGKNAGR